MAEWSLLELAGGLDRQTFFGSNFRNFPKYLRGGRFVSGFGIISRDNPLRGAKEAIYRPESHHRDSSSFSPCFLNSSPKCYQDRLSN